MKLSCLPIRAYLIPFADGTLETDRPAVYERLQRHLAYCDNCRGEVVRLEGNDIILRGYAARSRTARERQADLSGSATARGRIMTPLSSRVLAAIESDERFHSSNRWSPNGLSFATAALGVGVFVTIMNPQTAHLLLAGLFPHPQPTHVVVTVPKKPAVPYYPAGPAKDPMGGGFNPQPGITASGDSIDGASVAQTSATRAARYNVINNLHTPVITTVGHFDTPRRSAPVAPTTSTPADQSASPASDAAPAASTTSYDDSTGPRMSTVPDDSANQSTHKMFTDITAGGYSGQDASPSIDYTVQPGPPSPPANDQLGGFSHPGSTRTAPHPSAAAAAPKPVATH